MTGAESVSPDVLASVSKTERKRQEAIFELLSSERNYTDSLKFVREVSDDVIITSCLTHLGCHLYVFCAFMLLHHDDVIHVGVF